MATRENNTMAEGLSKLIKDIASMKLEPDADMPFLISLETDILNYLKPPVPQAAGTPQQQPGPPSGIGAMGNAMGQVMGGGGPPMPGGGGPMASVGSMSGPGMGMPNPDEFRRTLGQATLRGASRQLVHRMVNLNPPT